MNLRLGKEAGLEGFAFCGIVIPALWIPQRVRPNGDQHCVSQQQVDMSSFLDSGCGVVRHHYSLYLPLPNYWF